MEFVARMTRFRISALNVNVIALVLLAVQNSAYLVLLSYSQQSVDAAFLATDDQEPDEQSPHAVAFSASHFLAMTELVKLILSLVWCAIEEVRAMGGKSALAAVTISESSSQTDRLDPPQIFLVSRDASDVSDDMYGDSDALKHNTEGARINVSSIQKKTQTLFSWKCFLCVFLTRMRHAIGLDQKYKETLLMVVPAIVYSIQGLLLIYALKLLDPTLFQVLYQVRIIFLAFMMRAVLDLRLSVIRWGALIALMFGITLAQLGAQKTRVKMVGTETDEAVRDIMNEAMTADKSSTTWSMEGSLDALAGGFLSAFSGVFMEFVLKKRGNHFSLSARNTQLAFFSIVYFILVFLSKIFSSDGEGGTLSTRLKAFRCGFFEGFTRLVWFLVLLQAIGGMLVALVMRYCDNIVKSFSTGVAIVLSGTASVYLFQTPVNGSFVLGSFLVIGSIMVYSLMK